MNRRLNNYSGKIEELSGFAARNKSGVWVYKLDSDYVYKSNLKTEKFSSEWLTIDGDGTITILKDYAWDGCSFKLNVLDLFIIGTPDGVIDINTMKPKTYYASLVHDALYQYMYYHSISRKQADRLFLEILSESRFRLRRIYYSAVRLAGWIFFIRKKRKIKKSSVEKKEAFA